MKRKTHIGDFETSTGNIDGSTNVYLWGFSDLTKKDRYIGVDCKSFLESVNYYKIKKMYFHNLKWDGKFILHELFNNGYEWVDNPFRNPKNPKQVSWMQDDRGVFYSINVQFPDGSLTQFKDTARLFPMSVDQMGKVLGLPKLRVDYDAYKHFDDISQVPQKLIDYLWRDIDIVIEVYKGFSEIYKGHGVTVGATALKSFKKHYGEYNYVKDFGGKWTDRKTGKIIYNNVLTVEEWEEIALSYRGGLVLFKKKWLNVEIKRDGYTVDYNSLYASAQRDNKLPYGRPMKHKPIFGSYCTLLKIHIEKGRLKDMEFPAFIPRNDNKTKYEVNYQSELENEYYTIWDFEFEYWKAEYDLEYVILDRTYFKTKYVFTDWINAMAHLKENAPNKTERNYHKGIMVNSYGKMAQKYRRVHREIRHDPEKLQNGVRYGAAEEWVEVAVISEDTSVLSPIHTGSAITALARCELLKGVQANRKSFVYGDTDSMALLAKAEGLKLDDNKFSCWKYEKHFSNFKFIKAKSYICQLKGVYNSKTGGWDNIEDVIERDKEWDDLNRVWIKSDGIHRALAGLSLENHHKVTFSNFEKGVIIDGGKKQCKNVKGGLILTDIKYTL